MNGCVEGPLGDQLYGWKITFIKYLKETKEIHIWGFIFILHKTFIILLKVPLNAEDIKQEKNELLFGK